MKILDFNRISFFCGIVTSLLLYMLTARFTYYENPTENYYLHASLLGLILNIAFLVLVIGRLNNLKVSKYFSLIVVFSYLLTDPVIVLYNSLVHLDYSLGGNIIFWTSILAQFIFIIMVLTLLFVPSRKL